MSDFIETAVIGLVVPHLHEITFPVHALSISISQVTLFL